MKSTEYELNITDVKRWGINMIKYIGIPALIYITEQLKTWGEIDWKYIYIGALWALIDIVHRFATDHTKDTAQVYWTEPYEADLDTHQNTNEIYWDNQNQ